jgi:LysR family nitrogen assimilation transcriptional regulator
MASTRLNLRQISTFIGVYEERSLSKASRQLHTSQSALSMQVQNLEATLEVTLFERSARGVTPTIAGHSFYQHVIAILRDLDKAVEEVRTIASGPNGRIRVGLMPTFTRSVCSPAITALLVDCPNVAVAVVEAYSGALTEKVAAGEFDFAIVPYGPPKDGIRTRWLGRDREALVRRAGPGLAHLAPVNLAEVRPLRLVLPSAGNLRRESIEAYARLHQIKIDALIEMDAMIGTLELVAGSNWMTILPQTICMNDLPGDVRCVHPINAPPLTVDYAVIEPASSAMSAAAAMFLALIEDSYRAGQAAWERGIQQA